MVVPSANSYFSVTLAGDIKKSKKKIIILSNRKRGNWKNHIH